MTQREYEQLGLKEQLAVIDALRAAKSEAERVNRAQATFWTSVAHDLRQPAQSLVLLTEIVDRQFAHQPDAGKIITAMKLAAGALRELLDSVLDVSRFDAGVVAPIIETVDLGLILGRLQNEYALRAAGKDLRMRSRSTRILIATDPNLLSRILRNLIENALRYTATGGVLVGVRRRDGAIRIDVIDTGDGIPADQLENVFHEFHRLRHVRRDAKEGCGLGLAIVARLADVLAAKVEVASKLGRGSRFSLLLPAAQAPAGVAPGEALPTAKS